MSGFTTLDVSEVSALRRAGYRIVVDGLSMRLFHVTKDGAMLRFADAVDSAYFYTSAGAWDAAANHLFN